MPDAHANLAYSTVATAPVPATSGVTVILQSGDGAKFPAAPFNVTIWPAGAQPLTTNAEIARCTVKVTDTLTLVRATSTEPSAIGPRSIVVGDQIAATITAKTLIDVETNEAAISVSAGNTTGTLALISTGTAYFAGGNNITLSQNAQSITISAPNTAGSATTVSAVATAGVVGTNTRWALEDHQHAGIGALGVNGGLTAGNTGSSQGTGWFQATNGMQLSQISSNNGSFTIQVQPVAMSYWPNMPVMPNSQSVTVAQSTSYFAPVFLPEFLSISYLRLPASWSAASTTFGTTVNTTFSASLLSTVYAILYSLGTGANSLSLQSVASGSVGMSQQWSLQANANGSQYTLSFNVTYPVTGGTSNLSTNAAISQTNFAFSTGSLSNFTGNRYFDIPFANSVGPGPFWLMLAVSSTVSTQATNVFTKGNLSVSTLMVSQPNIAINLPGVATNSSNALQWGVGSFSTNAIGTTASVALANISSSASHPMPYFQAVRMN